MKYKVYYVQRGWMENVEIYEVEADSQEEAEENFESGELVHSYHDEEYDEIGVDSELTRKIN